MTTVNSDEAGAPCFHIVAIGASAGGLDALERFFKHMPSDSGMAFVVIQHLSTDFKSQMEQLLARHTKMPIHRVQDGIIVESNAIYLIPPGKMMAISNGRLLLTDKDEENRPSLPIDEFFRSLANEAGRFAIAIVLSGTGSDGSKGVVSLAKSGGLVIAQDEDSAAFDSMPLNAVATGVVTLAIPPEIMPDALLRYVNESLTPAALADQDLLPEESDMRRVMGLLKKHSGIDFTQYKTSTVTRRIRRRLLLSNTGDLQDYLAKIESDEPELDSLFQDLLIGVTRFFRDAEMFSILENQVIPDIIEKYDDDETIRIWVTACATGEEAYSIAMLFVEQIEKHNRECRIKIFATDVHDASIKFASIGEYTSESLENVSKARKERFFDKKGDRYCVTKEIRKLISFAKHNLISDAPFTKMDFISCRNVLIYLQSNVQKKVLSLFHFSLKTNAILSLGSSETLGELADEFEEISARHRLFSKKRDVRLPAESRFSAKLPVSKEYSPSAKHNQLDGPQSFERSLISIYDRLLDEFLPASYLLDDKFNLAHIFAGGEKFLRLKSGRPSASFLDMIPDELRSSFAGALNHCKQEDKTIKYSGIQIKTDSGELGHYFITARPMYDSRTRQSYFYLSIAPNERVVERVVEEHVNLDTVSQEHIRSLESELRFTQENLQATIEELETANEELQASNEELVASNEELQSTNEELQSLNEELYTVNTENQKRIEEIARANNDMDNLLATTRVGVIFLDSDLCIRRFTPEIARLFNLLPQDVGRSISGFAYTLVISDLEEKLQSVFETGNEYEAETEDKHGTSFILRILPYRASEDSAPEGVLLTLIDISRLKTAQQETERFKLISDSTSDGNALVDKTGEFIYNNRAFSDSLDLAEEQIENLSIQSILADNSRDSALKFFADGGLGTRKPFATKFKKADGSVFDVEINTTPFVDRKGKQLIFLNSRDISDRVKIRQDLELRTTALESAKNGVVIANNAENREIIYANEGFKKMTGFDEHEIIGHNCRFLQGEDTDDKSVDAIRKALAKEEPIRITLKNYRKSGELFWNELQISPVADSTGVVKYFIGVTNDVTAEKEAQEVARDNSRRLELLFNSTEEGIYFVDSHGICTFCNESAVRLLGYSTAKELLGSHIQERINITKEDGSAFKKGEWDVLTAISSGEEFGSDKEYFWRKDGSSFPVEYWSHPIKSSEGGIDGSVITFIDITERRANEKEMLKMQQEAEKANHAKSIFLANISHELRTPLTAILGFTQLLTKEVEDLDAANKISVIKRNGEHLLELLNDLLDLSKIESGFLKIELEMSSLSELLNSLASVYLQTADSKGLTLLFEVPQHIPEVIEMDSVRVRQVVSNLVGNAIKFTSSGQIKLAIAHSDARKEIIFTVTDTGPGIRDEDKESIFDAFKRGRDVRRHGQQGSGLGLSISLQLARQMGGDIVLTSQIGKGSQFVFTLPYNRRSQSSLSPSVVAGSQKNSSNSDAKKLPRKITIVEDDTDIREFLALSFRQDGAEVELFVDGEEVVESFLRRTKSNDLPDIVLMDIQMPRVDGIEAITQIRAAGIEVPVIAITANAMKGERERFLSAGFDDSISKPLDIDVLRSRMSDLLSKMSALGANGAIVEDDAILSGKKVVIIDDHEDIARIYSEIFAVYGLETKSASTGKAAKSVLSKFSADVALVDVNLPDYNGLELVKELKKISPNTKFIASSGSENNLTQEEEREIGLSAYLLKPTDLESLLGTIKSTIATA